MQASSAATSAVSSLLHRVIAVLSLTALFVAPLALVAASPAHAVGTSTIRGVMRSATGVVLVNGYVDL